MSAHTPTPWTDDKFIAIPAGDDRLLLGMFKQTPKVAVRVLSEENYQHAAKCVNACEGMDDPEKWIKHMKEYRAEMFNSTLSAEVDKRMELQSELESLRSERDGLVEALRDAWSALKEADRRFSIKTGNALSESITQTLAKYEK